MRSRAPKAQRPDEKSQRRELILEAARELCGSAGAPAFTMAELAEATGLSKGTMYLYFESKEQVFLALLEGELAEWSMFVDEELDELRGADEVGDLLAGSLVERPLLTRLLAMLQTIEQGLDAKSVRRLKRTLREGVLQLGEGLEHAVPGLRGRGVELVLLLNAVVIGVEHMADPPAATRQAMRAEGAMVLQIDRSRALARGVAALFHGLQHAPERRKR